MAPGPLLEGRETRLTNGIPVTRLVLLQQPVADQQRDVTLTDLPLDGLLIAQKRAEADGLTARCIITQSDGAALPFRDATFDAIYHSDVLCCLVDKRGVLESCRRVINPDGGRMAFSVIMIAPGLSDADYAIAAAGGDSVIGVG